MYDRPPRTMMIDKGFDVEVTFFSDEKIKVKGKLYDISERGVCVLIKQVFEEPELNSEGMVKIEKSGRALRVPVRVKWVDPLGKNMRCMGFQAKYNLSYTDMSPYIK
jgi:hypothetical protein